MIKKIIGLLTVLISLIVVMLSYTSLVYIDSTHIDGVLHNVSLNEKKDENLFELTFPKENVDESINDLLTYAHKNHLSISFDYTEYHGDKISNYFYLLSHHNNDLNHVIIDKKEDIDFSKYDKAFYYTTDLSDHNASGYMMTLNPHYYEGEQYVKYLCNMNGIKEVIQKEETIFFHFYTSSSQEVENMKQVLSDSHIQYNDLTEGYSPVQINEIFNDEVSKIAILFVVASVMVVLLIITDVMKQKRTIMIKRLNGVSCFKILLKEYGLFFIEEIIVFSLSLILFMYMKTGAITFYNKHYYAYAKVFIGVFALLMSVFMVIVYIFMNKSTQLKYLKMDHRIKHFSLINMVIKAVVLSLLISPLSTLLNGLSENITEYDVFHRNAEVIKNIGEVSVDSQSTDTEINVFNYLVQNGGLYCDFLTYQNNTSSALSEQFQSMDEDIDEEDIQEMAVDFPYIYANANYLKGHEIKDENGKTINLKSFHEDVVFVPKRYKNEDIKKMMWGKDLQIIYIQDTDNYFNYALLEPYYLSNPVICLVTHHSDLVNSSMNFYVDLKNKSTKDYQKEIKEKLNTNINVLTNDYTHFYMIKNIKQQLEETALTLIVYILFILIFIYQTSYMYLNENKKKMALEYMYGYTFKERYQEMFIYSLISYLVVLIVGMISVRGMGLWMFVGGSLVFELIIEMIMISLFERKNIASIFKGEA